MWLTVDQQTDKQQVPRVRDKTLIIGICQQPPALASSLVRVRLAAPQRVVVGWHLPKCKAPQHEKRGSGLVRWLGEPAGGRRQRTSAAGPFNLLRICPRQAANVQPRCSRRGAAAKQAEMQPPTPSTHHFDEVFIYSRRLAVDFGAAFQRVGLQEDNKQPCCK